METVDMISRGEVNFFRNAWVDKYYRLLFNRYKIVN